MTMAISGIKKNIPILFGGAVAVFCVAFYFYRKKRREDRMHGSYEELDHLDETDVPLVSARGYSRSRPGALLIPQDEQRLSWVEEDVDVVIPRAWRAFKDTVPIKAVRRVSRHAWQRLKDYAVESDYDINPEVIVPSLATSQLGSRDTSARSTARSFRSETSSHLGDRSYTIRDLVGSQIKLNQRIHDLSTSFTKRERARKSARASKIRCKKRNMRRERNRAFQDTVLRLAHDISISSQDDAVNFENVSETDDLTLIHAPNEQDKSIDHFPATETLEFK